MKKILIIIPFLLMIGGCNNLENREVLNIPKFLTLKDVSKSDYVLTNIFPNQDVTLGFNENGRIFGYSGMNRYFGKAQINGNNINIEVIGTTRMSGTDAQLITETVYLDLLKTMKEIELKDNKLILMNDKGETLEFIQK